MSKSRGTGFKEEYEPGTEIRYQARTKKIRKGVVTKPLMGQMIQVELEGDPFPVWVDVSQIKGCKKGSDGVKSDMRKSEVKKEKRKMPKTKTATLRKKAKELGVEGWDEMGRDELEKAVKSSNGSSNKPKKSSSKKSTSKKAPAKKKSSQKKSTSKKSTTAKKKTGTKKASGRPKKTRKGKQVGATTKGAKIPKAVRVKKADVETHNPYREGSNLHEITPLLVKGGIRNDLARDLKKQIGSLNPYRNDKRSMKLDDYDKRIMLCAQDLRDEHGFTIVRGGRGMSGFIQALPPGYDPPKSVQ